MWEFYFLCLGITEYSNTSPPTQSFYGNHLNNTCTGTCLWMLEISQSNQLILFCLIYPSNLISNSEEINPGFLATS